MNSLKRNLSLVLLAITMQTSTAVFAEDDMVDALTVDVAVTKNKADNNSAKIESTQAGAKATQDALQVEIANRVTADEALANGITNISLTPGPQGLTGDAGSNGTSCAVAQGSGSATITCGDVSNITLASVYDGADGNSVTGNVRGDMQYWDGAAWILIAAPAGVTTGSTSLNFCQGVPTWGLCTYAIGRTGPAGGIVFYVDNTGLHGLEAAPVDQAINVSFGCYENAIRGAEFTRLGSGARNTLEILEDDCGSHPAASIADAYSLNGYSDWYLPSYGELIRLSLYSDIAAFNFDATYLWYWSSTEYSDRDAWTVRLRDGSNGISPKHKTTPLYNVRAIRAF